MRELSLVQEGYHLLIFRPFHTLSCTIADRQINPGVPLEGFQLNKEILKSFEGLPQQHQRSTDEIWSARTKKKKGHQRIQESENTSPSKEIRWSCRFTLPAKSLQTVFKKNPQSHLTHVKCGFCHKINKRQVMALHIYLSFFPES